MGRVAATCEHGHDICPCQTVVELAPASWPASTQVTDAEGDVIEAATKLRDAFREGNGVIEAMRVVSNKVDALEALFAVE
jgi:hypothetical protein